MTVVIELHYVLEPPSYDVKGFFGVNVAVDLALVEASAAPRISSARRFFFQAVRDEGG
jgi:hypothetical protein